MKYAEVVRIDYSRDDVMYEQVLARFVDGPNTLAVVKAARWVQKLEQKGFFAAPLGEVYPQFRICEGYVQ